MRGFAQLAYDREPRPTTDIDPYAQPNVGYPGPVASYLDLVEGSA
jgi:hypothetical protein